MKMEVQVSSSKLKTLHCYHSAQTSGMRKLVKFRQPRANFRRLVTPWPFQRSHMRRCLTATFKMLRDKNHGLKIKKGE